MQDVFRRLNIYLLYSGFIAENLNLLLRVVCHKILVSLFTIFSVFLTQRSLSSQRIFPLSRKTQSGYLGN